MASSDCFPSKVDFWLAALPAVGVVLPLVMVVTIGLSSGDWSVSVVVLGIVLCATVFIVWLFVDTSYTVTDDSLLVRCGPLRQTIPLASITSIQPSRSVLSAPALSLDRLEISYGGGRVLVSPRDTERFIARLRDGVPLARVVEPRPATAGSSTALVACVCALVVLHAVVIFVAVAMVREAQPAAVDIRTNTLSVGSRSVAMTTITDISLENSLPRVLRRRRGLSVGTTLRGSYTLDTLGDGDVYVDRSRPPFLLVRTDHDYLVVNLRTAEDTRALYDKVTGIWHRPATH